MPAARPVFDRFWEKVDPEPTKNGCLLWTGAKTKAGYGQIGVNGKVRLAHRVAWFLEYGSWPARLLLHTCDTPSCVTIAHLFEGTHGGNARDMTSKGRHWSQRKTHCKHGHPFAATNLLVQTLRDGRSVRVCATCAKRRSEARRKGYATGESNGKSVLTLEVVRAIRAEYPKLGIAELSRKHSVSRGAIDHVVHRRTWRNA